MHLSISGCLRHWAMNIWMLQSYSRQLLHRKFCIAVNCTKAKPDLSDYIVSSNSCMSLWCLQHRYRCPCFSKDDSFMLPLQIVVREVFRFVEERETAGRHWKSVDLNDLSCIFTAHLAELKQSLTTVLYSQWDQLAQSALPLHLDRRFLFDSGKTKGQDLWQYHQNEKTIPIASHWTTDYNDYH